MSETGSGKNLESAGSVGGPGLVLGRIAGVLGLLMALVGTLGADVSFEFLGIVLGGVGYVLGSRRLGVAVVIFSAAMMILVLVVARGYLPGIEPTYPGLF